MLWNVNMEETKGVNTKGVCQNHVCSISENKKESIAFTYHFMLFMELSITHCHFISLHAHTHTHTHSHMLTHTCTEGRLQCTQSASLYPALILF